MRTIWDRSSRLDRSASGREAADLPCPGRLWRAYLAGLVLILVAAAVPASAGMVYDTSFDGLLAGPTQPFPGDPGQDGWFRELADGDAYGEIQEAVAYAGRALHEFAPATNPEGAQTIDGRLVTPPDLGAEPFVTLSCRFLCRSSSLEAVNPYDARLEVTGGPHPGFLIVGFGLRAGNGEPKEATGVNLDLVRFNGVDNNEPIPLEAGQHLAWDAWHSVTLAIDQSADTWLYVIVDGVRQDLTGHALPRSFDGEQWARGQLIERINAQIIPGPWPPEHVTDDDVFWDDLSLRTGTGPSAWRMRQRDAQHTGRADFAVPASRLNASFFDVFRWQKPAPDSPWDGYAGTGSMPYFDGAGPGGADLVVGPYHWPKGVQGMDRHTGALLWSGNPMGGESIARNTPAFSADGSVLYVVNDATESPEWPDGHPLMAFRSTDGPGTFWHNGANPEPGHLGMDSPTIAPDGQIFLHEWDGRPYAGVDVGDAIYESWSPYEGSGVGHSDPSLHGSGDDLRVVVGSRRPTVDCFGAWAELLWSVDVPVGIDASPVIDPADGRIYVPAGFDDIWVVGLDRDGNPLWGQTAYQLYSWEGGTNDPRRAYGGCLSHDGETLYFQATGLAEDGALYAINTADGSLKWTVNTHARLDNELGPAPIVTLNGVVIVGNGDGDTYYAILDEGGHGTVIDSIAVDPDGAAISSPTLSDDGMLYLPLRTVWLTGNGDGDIPSGEVENLFAGIDLRDGAVTTLPPPAGQKAYALDARVLLEWRAVIDPAGAFDHYAIYRDTAPFTSVAGMAPIGTVTDRETEGYEDATAENGTSYWYAVTAVTSTGLETTQVAALGPRTPRHEADLQVVCIARTPRFPRYDPVYSWYEVTEPSGFGPYGFSAATGLGSGQTEETPRWPELGDPVAYTATVRNRGTVPLDGLVAGEWRLDGVPVGSGERTALLAPGDTLQFTLPQIWDGADHELQFVLTAAPADERPENDLLSLWTRSVPFLSFIDHTRLEAFREETPGYPQAATDDFIDWLNRHMVRFNEMFAQAGSPKRVHFDVLETLTDDEPDPAIDTLPFAIFPFRYRADDGSLRLSGYYEPADDIDYGLLHEMAHQLGLIDLYQLDLPPGANQVSGTGYGAPDCLMRSCSHFLSPHSARAMTHWQDVAHGYYGQYLYCLPEQIQLRVLDDDGQPLEGATVRLYQAVERPDQGVVITSQVKAEGVTGAGGLWTLPNVPIDTTMVPTTFAGDRLRPNPFGYVAVVGTNGVLLIEVELDGFRDYAWLDITEANNAYWEGAAGTWTVDRSFFLGGEVEGAPPEDMTELNASSWTAWSDGGTTTLSDDTGVLQVGAASLRFETTGCYDNYVRYPGDHLARWNLSGATHLRFWARADNPDSFQDRSPWIRLRAPDGYIELHPTWDVLNEAIGQWVEFLVPLAGDDLWERTEHGQPDLTRIAGLDLHADTWDCGFVLGRDGMRFEPQPPSGVPGPGGAAALPSRLSLAAPRPNPVSASTAAAELRFDLPRAARVRVDIFDVGGRRLRVQADAFLPAGRHAVAWDARDPQGRAVPSGVYFVRMEAEGRGLERKLVVRK